MTNIGHIYKLKCSETGKVYIGSTIGTLKKRLWQHQGKSNSCASRDFIKPTIQLIETIEYTDYEKLLWRERFHIDTTECVNQVRPIITKEEKKESDKKYNEERKEERRAFDKKYYEKHKEERLEYQKKYNEKHKKRIAEVKKKHREKHKEEISKKRKVKINCDCGGKYRRSDNARHLRSKKHQEFIG